MKKKRYNIGLVVANIEDDFSNSICKGALQAAEELDDNLFIIPVKYLDYFVEEDPLQQYEYQYNTLLSYAQVRSLDIVLICLGSIGSTATRERYLEALASFHDVPVILIASNEDGYSCIRYDNTKSLEEGIEHLILTEKRTHIGMLSGYTDNTDSAERLAAYKNTLQKHGLSTADSLVKFSSFDAKCSVSIDALLSENPLLDAIVCGNDAIAIAAYQALEKRHIAIGEQISIIGFDDIEAAKHLTPPLATVRASASELGFRAVLQGHRKLLDNTVMTAETFLVNTRFVYRESIGIHSKDKTERQKQMDEQDRLFEEARLTDATRELIQMNHNMNILSRDMLMLGEEAEQSYLRILNCLTNADIQSSYLFTLKEPTPFLHHNTWQQPDYVFLKAYLQKGKAILPARTKQQIPIHDIYRNPFLPEERKTYVLIDLYSREMQYGFMLCDISFKNFHYVEFLCYQISIAIKLMHMFEVQRILLAEKDELVLRLQRENLQLDAISGKDELTGILNRRGFYKKANDFIDHAQSQGNLILFAYSDLNYLKQINDLYGHAEGDFAIQSCAKALEAVFPNSIAGRIGGDEFAVLALLSPDLTEAGLKASLNRQLAEMAALAKKPYVISVSTGMVCQKDGSPFLLEEAIETADALLYEEKRKKPPFGKELI